MRFHSDVLRALAYSARNNQDDVQADSLERDAFQAEGLPRLFNATGHPQSGRAFARLGWNVAVDPGIRRVPGDYDSMVAEGRRVAREILAEARADEQLHVLVGGAQIIIEAAIIELSRARQCRFYAAETERLSNPDGSFRFQLRSIAETPMSRYLYQS